MDAFDFDKRRTNREIANRRNIEFLLKQSRKIDDSIQENVVSSSCLQDNLVSVETKIKNALAVEERLDKKVAQKNVNSNTRLKSKWVYWGYEEKTPHYKKNLRKIKAFSTVEEFFSIYHKIKDLHPRLVDGDVYSVFKEGIMPLVDDHRNELGGEWMICFERDDKGLPANMEKEWFNVLWMVLVEGLGEDDAGICGVDIDIRGFRNRDVISVWTSDWTNIRQLESIRTKIVSRLHLGKNTKNVSISYQTHH